MSETGKSIVEQGSEMVARMLALPAQASGRDFNDLLSLFWRGLPIAELEKLLECPSDRVIQGALLIAEELDAKAAPVLQRLIGYLKSDDPLFGLQRSGELFCARLPDGLRACHLGSARLKSELSEDRHVVDDLRERVWPSSGARHARGHDARLRSTELFGDAT